uniref:Uncharacterized protein n=1 Tax=Geobacter metallireducens TaxID=28232 RepID=A0A831UJ82_GEOME
MKTQISRDSFQPEKRYTGIHQQQGRVITDADWNELVAICREQLLQALADVVGNGTPRTGAVAITADRKIQPGDLYVDGIRAELPGSGPIAASAQPDLPGYPPLPATGPYIVYADVWERTVTSLEDSRLRDPGLHGADTCTRTQTMLQVKSCPETVNPETGIPRRGNGTLSLSLHTNLEAGDPCDPCAGLIAAGRGRVGNYLFRLEVHAVEGAASNPTRLVLKWSSENGAEQYEALAVDKMPPGFVSSKYVYEFYNTATEKQLGVFLGTGFTPTHGVIKGTYEIPAAPPREFVRRWDGYCELARTGAVWSLVTGVDRGVTLTTGGSPAAPGHVTIGSSVQINLEALQLTLDLAGRTFVAGDFWLGMVREAVLNPGDAVLTGAEPRGIVHHYLRLARVHADGTVVPFENDADRRRHSFPPLTDLHAHDVGYVTTCSSGLFDASHDNVEKALNRLCQLAAEHIAYTASCAKGLYAGFAGTVKQALDKICEIQASHVGFAKPCDTSVYKGSTIATVEDALKLLCNVTAGQIGFAKPCDTSIYQGQTVATVEDALKLLCNVTARQIAYTPGSGCTFLNQPGIDTVQEALDALCARPSGGGCRITVGEGGAFPTLEDALKSLLDGGRRDICICLLPGDHQFQGRPIEPKLKGSNISISGCGRGSRLHIVGEPARFARFDSVAISDMDILAPDVPIGALFFDRCREVSMAGTRVYGFITDRCLVGVQGCAAVEFHRLVMEAIGPDTMNLAAEIFGNFSPLADLFRLTDSFRFQTQLPDATKALTSLPLQERHDLSAVIGQRVKGATGALGPRERRSYQYFVSLLRQDVVEGRDLIRALEELRGWVIRYRPAEALSILDARADWTIRDCDIFGIVTLHGMSPAGPLQADLTKNLDAMVKQGRVTFGADGTQFRVDNLRASRIDIGIPLMELISQIVAAQGGNIADLFSSASLAGVTLFEQNNQMAFLNTSLSSSVFDFGGLAALLMGSSAIYVGNRGQGETVIMNITPPGRSERAANLGLVITG